MPQIELVRPLRLSPTGGSELTIANRGSNNVFYGRTPSVSSTNKIGTLANGEALTLESGFVWVVAEKVPAILDLREKEFASGGGGGPGEKGEKGLPGGNSFTWTFEEGTEVVNATTGKLGFDNANYSLVKKIFVSPTSALGQNLEVWLTSLTTNGIISLYSNSNPVNFATFELTKGAEFGFAATIGVSAINSNGKFPTTAGDLVFSFVPSGGTSGEFVSKAEKGAPEGVARLNAAGRVVDAENPGTIATLEQYSGATGGVTDNKVPFEKAIAALPNGGTIQLGAGVYRLSKLVVTASNISIVGQGMGASFIQVDDETGVGLEMTGSVGTGYALTANLEEGSYTVELSAENAANFSAGSVIFLIDPGTNGGGTFTARVEKVVGGVITLDDSSPVTLLTAGSSKAFVMTPIKNISLRNLTVQMEPASPCKRRLMFNMGYFQGCVHENVRIRFIGPNPGDGQTNRCGGEFFRGRDLHMIGCVAEDIIMEEPLKSNNGGKTWEVDGVTSAHATDCEARHSACGIVFVHSPRSSMVGCHMQGRTDALGRGLKFLAQSNYSAMIGNVISGFDAVAEEAGAIGGSDFQIEDSGHCTIQGNTGMSSGYGGITLIATVTGANLRTHHNVVNGNVLRTTGVAKAYNRGVAIDFGGTATEAGHNIITNNLFQQTGGIEVNSSKNLISGNKLLETKRFPDITCGISTENLITGNLIQNAATEPSKYKAEVEAEASLVSYWRLGDAGETGEAVDVKTTNPGTYKGAVPKAEGALAPSGDTNKAAVFNGNVANYVSIANNASLELKNAFSLELWVRVTEYKDGGLFEKSVANKFNTSFNLYLDGATGRVYNNTFKGGVQQERTSINSGLPLGQWTHIVLTYDGTTMRMYQNGALSLNTAKITAPIDTGVGESQIGMLLEKVFPSKARIDEVAIYKAALSEARIQAHFEAATSGNAVSIDNTAGSKNTIINNVATGLIVPATQGVSEAMVLGKIIIPNGAVSATCQILLTRQAGGTNPGAVYESERKAGESFTVTSTSGTDTGTIAYQIFETA